VELVEIVAVVLAVLAVVLAVLVLRRRLLLRAGGAIDMSLRSAPAAMGRGWALGVGRYTADELQWFRTFAFSRRPSRVLPRSSLGVSNRRLPAGAEAWAVQSGSVIIECGTSSGGVVELAMSEDAMTGFLSWLESSPPGFGRPGLALG